MRRCNLHLLLAISTSFFWLFGPYFSHPLCQLLNPGGHFQWLLRCGHCWALLGETDCNMSSCYGPSQKQFRGVKSTVLCSHIDIISPCKVFESILLLRNTQVHIAIPNPFPKCRRWNKSWAPFPSYSIYFLLTKHSVEQFIVMWVAPHFQRNRMLVFYKHL